MREAAAYIKNTSDLYVEYSNWMKEYKEFLDDQQEKVTKEVEETDKWV